MGDMASQKGVYIGSVKRDVRAGMSRRETRQVK